MSGQKILVIGIGNAMRGDDGIGCAVAAALRGETGFCVLTHDGEPASLIEAWKEYGYVILVDAVSSGAVPGRVFRFDLRKESLPDSFRHTSTHAFGVAEAVELARVLDKLPQQIVFYGIEGGNFSTGAEISPDIASAIQVVLQRIEEEKAHA